MACCLLSFAFIVEGIEAVCAEDVGGATDLAWKLTAGKYFYSGYSGTDVNLRWRRQDTDAWLGAYQDAQFGSQVRAGADTSIHLGPAMQLQPSIQIAGGGFVGGSLTLQAGDAWFVFGGIGRTNLKPYFNLNFDPNDAVTVGAGHHTVGDDQYSVFLVEDDRLHTRQQDWHATARVHWTPVRLTIDVLRKTGLSDAGRISGWGLSTTVDFPTVFLRLARDPYQNFSAQSAWRFSVGARF